VDGAAEVASGSRVERPQAARPPAAHVSQPA
jgi:hypothetical protein